MPVAGAILAKPLLLTLFMSVLTHNTLPAELWRSLRHEWLWVYRAAVPLCGVWSREILVPAGVFFVEQGGGRIRVEGCELEVNRGQAFFSAPGLRQHWFQPGSRLLSVGFRSYWPDGTPLFRQDLNMVLKSPQLRQSTLRLFQAVHGTRKEVTYLEAIQSAERTLSEWLEHDAAFNSWFSMCAKVLMEAGVSLEARTGSSRRRVDQLLAWLNSRPLDQLSPSLPSGFPLGLRRAEQLIQQHLGYGMRAFLERRRLLHARERVSSGQGTLKEIAFSLGFRHASHFTTWFRRHTGSSPSACRRDARQVA